MAVEIERKFLVAGDGWRDAAMSSQALEQGYLNAQGRCSVRVRIAGEVANLNIKAAVAGAARAEYEYPIPPGDARELLAGLCALPPVVKRRYLVPYAGRTWEVDEFAGANAGLVVAEIELESVGAAFDAPPWLGREVTGERRYYNHALAERPYREWRADER